jgi:hypothetical protein
MIKEKEKIKPMRKSRNHKKVKRTGLNCSAKVSKFGKSFLLFIVRLEKKRARIK